MVWLSMKMVTLHILITALMYAVMRICNSFDLVRLHKFSHLDINLSKELPINKLPSYIKMIEFISKDEKVMFEFGQSKLKSAINDFSSLYNEDNKIYEINKLTSTTS